MKEALELKDRELADLRGRVRQVEPPPPPLPPRSVRGISLGIRYWTCPGSWHEWTQTCVWAFIVARRL